MCAYYWTPCPFDSMLLCSVMLTFYHELVLVLTMIDVKMLTTTTTLPCINIFINMYVCMHVCIWTLISLIEEYECRKPYTYKCQYSYEGHTLTTYTCMWGSFTELNKSIHTLLKAYNFGIFCWGSVHKILCV